jgi:hypothetical protein
MATAGARYTNVSSQKWEDDWYLGVLKDPRQKILFDFLCEGSHGTFAGVFKLDPGVARYKTGPWRAEKLRHTLDDLFAGHVFRYRGNWWFIRTYLHWNGAKDGALSKPQATGVLAIVREAPIECRAHFWIEYASLFEPHGEGMDSLSIPSDYPMVIPIQSNPHQSSPRDLVSSTAETTPEQKSANVAAVRHFDESIKEHTGLAKPPGWNKNAPRHAGAFFKERLLDGDTAEDLIACIDEYFRRKREAAEEIAQRKGKRIHTNVSFTHFRSQYTSLLGSVADA